MVRSNHRRSRRKLANSTRMLCIYLDNKRLGHKCPCKSQGGALSDGIETRLREPALIPNNL
jgi:hypothetical protein